MANYVHRNFRKCGLSQRHNDIICAPIRFTLFHLFVLCLVLLNESPCFAKVAVAAGKGVSDDPEDVITLAPFEVKGDRLEEFGFGFQGVMTVFGTSSVMVTNVFPNTPAAKAGLRPGELIYDIDGKSMSFISKMSKLHKMQERKWAELEAGRKSVSFSLEVRSPGEKDSRIVTMVLPSPAPHWGSKTWSAPEGRMPAVVQEAGPIAVLTREVLDNGIWSVLEEESFLGAALRYEAPILGFEWSIDGSSGAHRIWVTQQRGKTEIMLEHRSREGGYNLFLTSPLGAMDKARCWPAKKLEKGTEIPPEEIRSQFEAEIDFWLTKVGRVTGRWPFESLSGKTDVIASSSNASSESGDVSAPLGEAFPRLPIATAAQKELFVAALGKVGINGNCWAYTETSRSFGDDHETTVRFDPSKPLEERSTLLKVDGKNPKAAYLKHWRNEGHIAQSSLGELPAISSVVDVNDVRIYSDETAAIVFELPVKASNSEISAEKFRARFRVNKANRAFEDFSVNLRKSMHVAGIAKITDAGLEARFQTFDPALAPEPVFLRMGGGVRVLFVKISRAFEATRTDFKRVVPFENELKPAL